MCIWLTIILIFYLAKFFSLIPPPPAPAPTTFSVPTKWWSSIYKIQQGTFFLSPSSFFLLVFLGSQEEGLSQSQKNLNMDIALQIRDTPLPTLPAPFLTLPFPCSLLLFMHKWKGGKTKFGFGKLFLLYLLELGEFNFLTTSSHLADYWGSALLPMIG